MYCPLRGGFNYDSTSIPFPFDFNLASAAVRQPFHCLSKLIEVTVTQHISGRWPASRITLTY